LELKDGEIVLYSLDDTYQNSTGRDTPVTQLVVQTGADGPSRHWNLVMEVVSDDGDDGEMTTYWTFDSLKPTPTMIRNGRKPLRTMNEVITRLLQQRNNTTVFAVCSRVCPTAIENGIIGRSFRRKTTDTTKHTGADHMASR
jgi:hypothetical protein